MVKLNRKVMRTLLIVCLLFAQLGHSKSYNGFDVSNSLIDKKDIVQGGPPRDGIPAISTPHYVSSVEASFMRPTDIVLGFALGNQSFAYPRHIMNWHEIVNDVIGDDAFVISYCPLCGSGMAFSSKLGEQRLDFGVSGLLYNNDLLFYDRQTESLWSQIERKAISGKFAGRELEQLPLQHVSWKAWLKKYPNTKVLSENQGVKRNYRHDPYTGYDTSSKVFFKTLREAPSEFHSKEKVLGLSLGDSSVAYPFSELQKQGAAQFDDELAGVKYKVRWDAQDQTATLEAYGSDVLTPTVAFWFAWYNFYPETDVFRAK